jgi:hypothetical protein
MMIALNHSLSLPRHGKTILNMNVPFAYLETV